MSVTLAFIIEAAERNDTITYWLRDTTLVNQDTLRVQLSYMMTDSLGVLQPQTDTLEILAKVPYEKRMKQLADQREEWQKKQDKAKKRGKPYETKMPVDALKLQLQAKSEPAPDENVLITLPSPLARIDTAAIHLYAKHDTLWKCSADVRVTSISLMPSMGGSWCVNLRPQQVCPPLPRSSTCRLQVQLSVYR